MISLWLLLYPDVLAASSTPYYKCEDPKTGTIEYSIRPCEGKVHTKTIVTKDQGLTPEPQLPANIPGRNGQMSPEKQAPVADPNARAVTPNVPDQCRTEAFAIRRSTDMRIGNADRTTRTNVKALETNRLQLEKARDSLVADEWSRQLNSERERMLAENASAIGDKRAAISEEKSAFAQLVRRCGLRK